MAQRSGCARFAHEALAGIRQVDVTEEELQCDVAIEDGVVGKVQRAHASETEATLNLVPSDEVASPEHKTKTLHRVGKHRPPDALSVC